MLQILLPVLQWGGSEKARLPSWVRRLGRMYGGFAWISCAEHVPEHTQWPFSYPLAAFSAFIKQLEKKKPVIVCGDMNCARHPIDIHSPKTNLRSAGFTQVHILDMIVISSRQYAGRSSLPSDMGVFPFTAMTTGRARFFPKSLHGWRPR